MRFLLTLIFLSSCAQNNPNNFEDYTAKDADAKANKGEESFWICHNPGTVFHNEICVEKYFPEGCYVSGDNNKFCWILKKEDCDRESLKSQDFCKVFDEQ